MRIWFAAALAFATVAFVHIDRANAQQSPNFPFDPCATVIIPGSPPTSDRGPQFTTSLSAHAQGGSWRDGLVRKQVACDTDSPVYGTPNSVQAQAMQAALGLNDYDPQMPIADADSIGINGTYWKAGEQDGQRIDAWYRHAQNLSEGSRTRLVIDVPVSFVHANKERVGIFALPSRSALLGTLSVGVEFNPTAQWTLTPRVSYGLVLADKAFGGDRELATASLSSLYRIGNVGRGILTLGNMVGYSSTIDDILVDAGTPGHVRNWIFRNGLAYQLPLAGQLFGRVPSLRASYTFSILTKDAVAYDEVHQAAISIGVRNRESAQKSPFELLRLGVIYTHADYSVLSGTGYDAITLTLGYQF